MRCRRPPAIGDRPVQTAGAAERFVGGFGLAELCGTGLLVAVAVGSGIAARQLSPGDVRPQLLQNAFTTAFGLTVLIWIIGPGGALQPGCDARRVPAGRHGPGPGWRCTSSRRWPVASGARCSRTRCSPFRPPCRRRTAPRARTMAEVVATAGLLLTIFALTDPHRSIYRRRRTALGREACPCRTMRSACRKTSFTDCVNGMTAPAMRSSRSKEWATLPGSPRESHCSMRSESHWDSDRGHRAVVGRGSRGVTVARDGRILRL